ncbi:MAG: LamG-like jellyroll fold domain-containing protein [Gemmataceae bacterium]
MAHLLDSVTFYASFDEAVRGDFGKGGLEPTTRSGPLADPAKWAFTPGVDDKVYWISKDRGKHKGCLRAVDVLPGESGRFFFPAKGNIAFNPKGWAGTLSFWMSINPDTMLRTPFCDPIQITQQGATNGGIWIDFNDDKPRSLRMGVFPAADPPIKETDADAPLVWVKKPGCKAGDWHHLVITWENFDTGKPNALAKLYIDGKCQGTIRDRAIAMKWDLDKAGIYVAVNYIGLLDELALFDRALSEEEIDLLADKADFLTGLGKK